MLDPLTHAVRSDIADVRLAERVFAPHYAAPMVRALMRAATLCAEDGAALSDLATGDSFEVLEVSGTRAWGMAPRAGLVGYVEAAALEGFPA